MAAPALVALAHGSRDPRSAATITALVDEVRTMRPDLRIEARVPRPLQAVLRDGRRPAGQGRLRRDRRRAPAAHRGLPRQGRRPRGDRRGGGAPRGPQDPGHQDPRPGGHASSRCSTCGCARRSRRPGSASSTPWCWPRPAPPTRSPTRPSPAWPGTWGTRHKLPVTAAFASAAPPATGEAVRAFRAEGRRHIAVASLFLAPGFLPDRAAELATRGRGRRGVGAARARTRRSPARCWRATPSARWSSSPSEPLPV